MQDNDYSANAAGFLNGSPVAVSEARAVSKHYGRVAALSEVNFAIYRGEIVGLVGDNGAGKSTLVKILSGALQPSSGEVLVDGKPVVLSSPRASRSIGIETVYQDLALALHLSLSANIYLGREVVRQGALGWLGWLDKPRMAKAAAAELAKLRIPFGSVEAACESLSGGQRQAVAVARAVAWAERLVIMDEPTAALGVAEQHQVGELVARIRERGIPVLLVSHNLPQLHAICDRIVVLRHGRVVADLKAKEVSVERVVMWITGATDQPESTE